MSLSETFEIFNYCPKNVESRDTYKLNLQPTWTRPGHLMYSVSFWCFWNFTNKNWDFGTLIYPMDWTTHYYSFNVSLIMIYQEMLDCLSSWVQYRLILFWIWFVIGMLGRAWLGSICDLGLRLDLLYQNITLYSLLCRGSKSNSKFINLNPSYYSWQSKCQEDK